MTIHPPDSIPADRKIQSGRLVPFTPSQVFAAFRDPSLLARWWGPKGFTNTFDEFDFRPGGAWRFTMHSPDGRDFPNESRFLSIEEPSRIVLDHVCPPIFQANFKFMKDPEGCRIEWWMIFEDSKTCANVAGIVRGANEENLDRLVAVLKETAG